LAIHGSGPGAVYLNHSGDLTLSASSHVGNNAPVSISASNNLNAASLNTGGSDLMLTAGQPVDCFQPAQRYQVPMSR